MGAANLHLPTFSCSSGTSLPLSPKGPIPLITGLLKHKPKNPLKSLRGKELKVSTFSVMLLKLSCFRGQVAE